jgi:hypothetical protein
VIDFDLLRVNDVRHVRDHVLWLRFSDGVEGVIDLGDRLRGPVFEPLRDPALFAQAKLDYGYTVAWPNGADLAPEFLYQHLEVTGSEPKRDCKRLFDDGAARELAECAAMPEVSRFFEIAIRMFFTEREAPHFHAQYAEFVASVGIRDASVTSRKFPGRALKLVLEWRELHERELLDNWERLRRDEATLPIPPLD